MKLPSMLDLGAVQLCAASYDADLSTPLNDAHHAEVVPHDRTPRTSQRCGPGETYADVAQSVEHRAGRYVAGSNPAVCARGRVAPGQCETVVVMAHMEMTKLAENCTVGGDRLSVMVLHL